MTPLQLVFTLSSVLSTLAARDQRLFGLFAVERFTNSACSSEAGDGICTLAGSCEGSGSGTCGGGYGTCCVVEKSCRTTTSQKIAYFINPNYPETDSSDQLCDFRVDVTDTDVCQIRLDFEEFQTQGPEATGSDAGTCDRSYLDLGGSGPDVQTMAGKLCGQLTGQHVYIHLNEMRQSAADLAIMVRLEDDRSGAKWRIKVTQIDCSERGYLRAPTGCTQYFNETKGTFESFNFEGKAYTKNQDYNICIGSAFGTCKTSFSSNEFQLDMVTNSDTSGVGAASCDVLASGGSLRSDYLFLPGGSETGESPSREKYCGGVLHHTAGRTTPEPVVTKVTAPLVLRFKTDDNFDPAKEQGFRVSYEQSPTC